MKNLVTFTDRCNHANVTDAFFDACVFDFVISGDEKFVTQIANAQDDIIDLYSPYIRHYFTGRQNLTLYDSKAGYKWKQCIQGTSPPIQISGTSGLVKSQGRYGMNGLVISVLIILILTPTSLNIRHLSFCICKMKVIYSLSSSTSASS